MKKTALLILILCLPQASIAQELSNKTKNIMKVKFINAKDYIEKKQFDKALKKVDEIETLNNGKKIASAQNIRIKALIGKGDYTQAQAELDILYDLNPSSAVLKDVAGYTGVIEDGLAEKKVGTITDKTRNLMWMRCSLGQKWNKNTLNCEGGATRFYFEDAQSKARNYSYEGYNDWRLPTIKELETLVYCSTSREPRNEYGRLDGCTGDFARPTINKSEFPDAPTSSFWSASPDANSSISTWYVSFRAGYSSSMYSNKSHLSVRLVRFGH